MLGNNLNFNFEKCTNNGINKCVCILETGSCCFDN